MKRDSFSSRFGIISAATGAAIGLGNIWKFPYVAGIYGGASFIVIYLICIFIIGFPVMLSELVIGRRAQRNIIGAFNKLSPGKPWMIIGFLGLIAVFIIASFYSVVGGWTLNYIFKSFTGSFEGKTVNEIENMFIIFTTSLFKPIIFQILFMLLTCFVVLRGIKNGIEKYSKVLMPVLFIIIIILDIKAVMLPDAKAGIEFMLKPDWSNLNGEVVLVALGQAFFSLSLGYGIMITYGSYIRKEENLASIAFSVTIADTCIALLAGIAIFPAVFSFGINSNSGFGLVFIILPILFEKMFFGKIFQILFFVLLSIAALTSSISMLEVPVSYFIEEKKMKRNIASVLVTCIVTCIGVFASLSNGVLKHIHFLSYNFFDFLNFISLNVLLPIGGILITVYVGWFMKIDRVRAEICNKGRINVGIYNVFILLVKSIVPIMILIVFLNSLELI